MKILLAYKELKKEYDTGGPGAVNLLLANHLYKNNFNYNLLLNNKIIIPQKFFNSTTNLVNQKVKASFWQKLNNSPDSLTLNLLHSLSLYRNKIELEKILNKNKLNEKDVIIQSFLLASALPLSQNRNRKFKIVHNEQSKGGFAAEVIKSNPNAANTKFVKRFLELENELIKNIDAIIFPSKGALELYKNSHASNNDLLDKKSKIIYTGIEDLNINSKKGTFSLEPNLVVNVAQHVEEKDLPFLIKGAEIVKKTNSKITFESFGSETNLSKDIYEFNKKHSEAIIFKGALQKNKLLDKLAKAWVIVFTQKVAVFDLIVLEAMSLGKPILLTKVGGNIEALGEDYEFFIDEPSDIKFKLGLLENENIYRQVSSRNRKRFLDHFTIEKFVNNHINLWKGLINK